MDPKYHQYLYETLRKPKDMMRLMNPTGYIHIFVKW